MFLAEVEAVGSLRVRGLRDYINRLWDDFPASETHLRRFFIRLGRALASKKKRKEIPDWSQQGVDPTEKFIVEGWCGNIVVDGETWPPLCCFSTKALALFLALVKRPLWKLEKGT